jgi:hypothetical protein
MGKTVKALAPIVAGFYLGPMVGQAMYGAAFGASAATAASIAGVGFKWTAAKALGSMLVSGLVSKAMAPDIPDMSSEAAGIQLNKSANDAPIPVVYGRRTVGGTRVLMEVTGAKNEYLHIVLVLSEGEIDSVNNIYLNDVPIEDDRFKTKVYSCESNGHFRGALCLAVDAGMIAVGTPSTENLVFVAHNNGADEQAADPIMVSEIPQWTADHKLSGAAYLYVRLKYDSDAYQSGLPIITADVKGKKVYDPRTSTTAWSDNPALCIRDYLTNTRYGRGIDTSLIDDATFNAAANYCEEQVTIGGETKDRYTLNGVVDTSMGSMDVLTRLLTACRGFLVFSGGKYKLIIDKPETATFTFDEDKIVGEWSISLGDKNTKFNRMRANFFNPERDWQPDIAVVDSSANRTADNGLLLEKTIDLPFTSDIDRAKMIATINLNQSRQSITCEFTSTIEGLRCEVGDVVYINHTTPGWTYFCSDLQYTDKETCELNGETWDNTGKLFRIMRLTLQNNDEVRVLALEYDATAYDFGTIAVSDAAPNTNLPDPYETIYIDDITFEPHNYINGAMGKLDWSASSVFAEEYKIEFTAADNIDANYRQISIDLDASQFTSTWGVSPVNPKLIQVNLQLERGTDLTNAEYDGLTVGEYVGLVNTGSTLVNDNVFQIAFISDADSGLTNKTVRLECHVDTDQPSTWPMTTLSGATTILNVGATDTDVEGYSSYQVDQRYFERDTSLYLYNIEVGEYKVRITPISTLGVSGAVAERYIVIPPPPVPERVTGLEIDLGDEGEANATEWTGRDVKIKWRESSVNLSGEVDTSGGISFGGQDSYIKDYQVWVYNPSGFVLRREVVTDTFYTYTYEKNAEDAAKNGDTPYRTLTFKVRARSIHNEVSDEWAIL